MTIRIHHKERVVPLKIICKVSGDIIEQENIRSPNSAGWKLHPIYSSILLRVPLEIVILPVHVQPHQGGEDTLAKYSVIFIIILIYLVHVNIYDLLQSCFHKHLLGNTCIRVSHLYQKSMNLSALKICHYV